MRITQNYINTAFDSISPYIRNAGSGDINWQGEMRRIYDNQLILCVKGAGRYMTGEKQYTIKEGTLIFVKPDTAHTIVFDGDYRYMWVHFDFFYREDAKRLHEYVKSRQEELFKNSLAHTEWIRESPIFNNNFFLPDICQLDEYMVVENLLRKLIFEVKYKKTAYQLKCKGYLLEIFGEVISQIFEERSISISNPNYRVVYKVLKYIEENYFRDINLESLSKTVNLTGDYVSRIFKSETSYTAIEYLNHYRIKKAKELLMYDDLRICDVAIMVGFYNFNYFSRIFKKYQGVSPRDFCKISR